jgi:predicted ATPase
MLETFMVKGFRLFDQLEIAPLGRVNLFVGRNNSGKTALLEAIEIYASNASPNTLGALIVAREETAWIRESHGERALYANPIRHLFRGHSLPPLDVGEIVIGPREPASAQIRFFVGAFRMAEDADGNIQRTRLKPDEIGGNVGVVDLGLMAQVGASARWVFPLRTKPEDLRRATAIGRPANIFPCQVVPTRNMTPNRVAALWDAVGLTDLSKEVISGLNMIDSSIGAIQFVESESSGERVPLVRTHTSGEPLPLRSLGDGVTRLFHILMALVTARDGILLIDEFENGLHWSVQANVWKTIFRVASHMNVQVFATTHSRDCIRGFGEAWAEKQDSGTFFRLEAPPRGGVRAKGYNLETLTDAIESEVEVR